MSEIIRVVVDELPYGCEACRWMTYDGYCALTEKALSEVSDERDSECPLVTEKENIKQVFDSLDSEPKRYLYDEGEE